MNANAFAGGSEACAAEFPRAASPHRPEPWHEAGVGHFQVVDHIHHSFTDNTLRSQIQVVGYVDSVAKPRYASENHQREGFLAGQR